MGPWRTKLFGLKKSPKAGIAAKQSSSSLSILFPHPPSIRSIPEPSLEPASSGAQSVSASAHSASFHDAAKKGDLAKIQAILASDANLILSKDVFGRTALHGAALEGHKEVVELLLLNNAEVDTPDIFGATPLHLAAQNGHEDAAALLLACKASVQATNNDGNLPLHMAAQNGHDALVELLLACRAEINAKNNQGDTPLRLAVHGGCEDVAELLLTHHAECDIHDAAALGNLAKVKALLSRNSDLVFSEDNNGRTPLHISALLGNKETAEYLLAARADVNARDHNRRTPLHWAASRGHKDVAELLLLSNAEVNAKAHHGWTALYLAASHGHKEVAGLVREFGGHE